MGSSVLYSPSPTRFYSLTPTLSALSPVLLQQPYVSSSALFVRSRTLSKTITTPLAYVTGPASDPIFSECDPKIDGSDSRLEKVQPPTVIGWGLLWMLLMKHKLRLVISVVTLICCTTCTLSMPLFSGQFFEVLIGARPEPLWRLLGKVGMLYAIEPLLTVTFVTNMNIIWEKIMSTLRAHIFGKILMQKVEFFDRYKVGELTGLLTSDLGSLKDIVSENVARDRGFRALSEVIGTICILFALSPQLAPILGILMLTVSVSVGNLPSPPFWLNDINLRLDYSWLTFYVAVVLSPSAEVV